MKAPSAFHYVGTNSSHNREDYRACGFSYEPSVPCDAVKKRDPQPRVLNAFLENPFGPVSEENEVDVFSGNSESSHPMRPLRNEKFSSKQSGVKKISQGGGKSESSPINKPKSNVMNSSDEVDNSTLLVEKKTSPERPSNASKSVFKSRRVDGIINEDDWNQRKTPWHNRLKTDWSGHNKMRAPPPMTQINYHYHLFKLHCSAPPTPGLSTPAPLSIIIRSHLHGISMEHFNRVDKSFKSSSYVVYPKLENQLFFGCEVNSYSEILYQWVHLIARPNSELLQVRVCSESGEVALAEKRDLCEVLREGAQPHIKFHPGPLITSLYVALDTLRRKPPGQYLLHHHNRSEAFVHLLREAKEDCLSTGHQSVFDLHRSYGYSSTKQDTSNTSLPDPEQFVMDSRKFVSPPWLAINTLLPTSFHLAHSKIPCTFPMDNPNKKMTKKRSKLIKEKAKKKKSLFDSPEKVIPKHEEYN
ncbi:Little elongation complex subunit 2 C-terminal [Trinorchestia longiramus]|nr:Little elongation complex subunit 2 C-terminal [Trinorchestia longiramus]